MIDLEEHHLLNVYDLLSGQLENPKKDWFNRHLVNYGIINLLYRVYYKKETTQLVGLNGIISGIINGRKVDVGKIALDDNILGIIINAYGLQKCKGCNLENYCEGSYAAAGVFANFKSIFTGFRITDDEVSPGNCDSILYTGNYNRWFDNGEKQVTKEFKDRVSPERLKFGIDLTTKVAEAQEYIYYLKELKEGNFQKPNKENKLKIPKLKD